VHALPRGHGLVRGCAQEPGRDGKGKVEDVETIADIANNMMGNTICAFADGMAMPLLGLVRKFREEFVAAAQAGGLPAGTRHDNPTRALVEGKAA
jgi:hypothetical protein